MRRRTSVVLFLALACLVVMSGWPALKVVSDVLIEKSRSAVTDGQGVYRIVDLRPGVYVLTFTLTGFQTGDAHRLLERAYFSYRRSPSP